MHLRQIRFVFVSTLLLAVIAYADDIKKCNSPAAECERAIRQMLSARIYLGVQLEELNGGLRIKSIVPESPAQRGGLGEGDRLMVVNGQSLLKADIRFFKHIISDTKESGRLSLIIERGGILKKIDVRLEPYPKAQIDKIVAQHLAEAHSVIATQPQP